MQAQSGDAPRSFDRRRPLTKEMSTTAPVESSRVRRWRRLAARNLVRTIAEGFPGKQRTPWGFDKHWPACRLPSDKISPPKAARPDQNRPPPGGQLRSRVLEELAGAQRPAT